MMNQDEEQQMRQYLDDALLLFLSTSSQQFQTNHLPLFKTMEQLFRTIDPRKLFGLDCFKNKEAGLKMLSL
jgi:hypothetical protein